MKFVPISPDAQSTLNALKNKRALEKFDEKIAKLLVAAGVAEMQGRVLCLTKEGETAEVVFVSNGEIGRF